MWGVGCVFFEVLSLFPLFPGNDELDQVHKIHNILGTPPRQVLDHFQKYASHMDFNFPDQVGTGIVQLVPHVSPECQEFILKLLAYTPDDRLTAKQALNDPYFKDLKSQEKKPAPHTHGLALTSGLGSGEELPQDTKHDKRGSHVRMAAPEATNDSFQTGSKKLQQGSGKASDAKIVTMQDIGKHSLSNEPDDQIPATVLRFF